MESPTILIVDDEETVRMFIRRVLTPHGFELLEARDGVDALEKLQHTTSPVHLMVTDVKMPRMNGIELGRSVHNSHPETSVLYISGYDFDVDQERAQHPGRICDFLPKPFTPKVLLATVNKCLSSAKTASCA